MQAAQEKAAKQLADSGGVERGEFKKLSFSSPDSIGNDGVAVGVEVGAKCTEGLNRQDTAGPNVFAVKQRLEEPADGLVSGAGKETEQSPFALEQAADGLGDGKGPMAAGDRRQDLGGKLFGKQDGTLGLTTAAKVPRAA
jgi:hypothetical protein